ncbi:MAG: glucosamine-6-phosphate deaminase [Galactobacter sp.]
MDVVISATAQESARRAGGQVIRAIENDPHLVLGVATGSSPLGIYQEVSRAIGQGLDVSGITCFALDEYVGLSVDHPQSYHHVVQQTIAEPWGLKPAQLHVPDGNAADPRAAAAAYDAAIAAAGGVGLQILGIGSNGHIGFNEPGSSLASRTRIKTLHPRTRADNARFFDEDQSAVPLHCITQGIGTILDAGRVLLIAEGHTKAEAVAGMAEGPVSASCPASALQLHPHVQVFLDEGAASGLKHREYYDHAVTHASDLDL